MQTEVINTGDANSYASGLAQAIEGLRRGALVVFPTETVYGLAANAAAPQAVERLRAVKGRGDAQPFTVHVGQRRDARQFLTAPSPVTRRLIRKGWPGPLTLICTEPAPQDTPAAKLCPPEHLRDIYRNGTVGLRCPDHEAATRLLSGAGVPVVASSANRHGEPPPCDARAAFAALGGQVDYIIDAGPTRHSTASTIVAVHENTWRLVRAGVIDQRTIERWAVSDILFVCTGNSCRSPMAEYLFRQALAQRLACRVEDLEQAGYRIHSAGAMGISGMPASSGALDEMQRRGIDIRGHRSQALTVELVHRAERVYVMSPEHRRAVLDLVPGAAPRVELLDTGAVPDPIGGSAEQYRICADQIERAVQARLEEFLNEDRDW